MASAMVAGARLMLAFDYINVIRQRELEAILPLIPAGSRVLDIGAGSGQQALEMQKAGHRVSAIDLPSSDYARNRLFPVTDYDGRTIPFPDDSFDVVFSSNVLEHVADLDTMHAEIRRVLALGGQCLHIMPTHSWRFWTSVAGAASIFKGAEAGDPGGPMKSLRRAGSISLRRHGERGNVLSEFWLFRPEWWRRNFRRSGFELIEDRPIGYFYTAAMLLGPGISFDRRARMAKLLGSATHLFRLRDAKRG